MNESSDQNLLPDLSTTLGDDEIRQRLTKLSKQGKLPGFEPNEPGAVCSVAAHGEPFDSKLILRLQDGRLRFECVMLPWMPGLFVLLLIVTVWPGLPLTDTFLTSFDWYNAVMQRVGISTWHWYLPLTVLPAPFAFHGALRKSRRTARESALEAIEKIRATL